MRFILQTICGTAAIAGFASALPHVEKDTVNYWEKTNFLLAFGDSYTYVQGTHGLQNYSFIGDLQNYSYTPSELLSDKIVQNQIGTSAGGPNWVEYLTGCFSGLPSKCKTQLWDFAFAGSDVSTTFTPLHHNYTVSFENQIIQWNTYAHSVLRLPPSRTLVALFIGINDISDTSKWTFPHANVTATSFPELYTDIISAEFAAIEPIYQAGYRNFLVMNLPPLERTPGNVVPGATPHPNATMVQSYNSILASQAQKFAAAHQGTNALVFDMYSFLSGVLDHPAEYGITNTTGYCPQYNAPDIATNYAAYGCLPIAQYFWYNTGHITYHVHELLAGAVKKFLEGKGGGNVLQRGGMR